MATPTNLIVAPNPSLGGRRGITAIINLAISIKKNSKIRTVTKEQHSESRGLPDRKQSGPANDLPTKDSPRLAAAAAAKSTMDITIQHPWFKRALGPFFPSRLFDQYFGEGFFEYEFLPFFSSTISPYYRQSFFRSFLESGVSEVRSDRDKYTIYLDVKHFSPEDLSVKVIDDFVEIHGKHNERQDDHGYISREFHRRYRFPSNVDQSAFACSLSADGMLTFSAPRVQSNTDPSHSERPIPVTREEKPAAPSS
ncbi:alpha-crystallin A chain [Anolis carolinensis]